MYTLHNVVNFKKKVNSINIIAPNNIVYDGNTITTDERILVIYDSEKHSYFNVSIREFIQQVKAGGVLGVFTNTFESFCVWVITAEAFIIADNLEFIGCFNCSTIKDIDLENARNIISLLVGYDYGLYFGSLYKIIGDTKFHTPSFLGDIIFTALSFSAEDFSRIIEVNGNILSLYTLRYKSEGRNETAFRSEEYRYKYTGSGTLMGMLAKFKLIAKRSK